MTQFSRRTFIKSVTAASSSLGFGVLPQRGWAANQPKNTLPRWKGFNLLDFFSPHPKDAWSKTEEIHFKWMADWGFNFVRLPMAYPYFLKFNRKKPITQDHLLRFKMSRVGEVDQILEWADKYNLHLSLNLHRAPGFCVNAGFEEPYNLWQSDQALADFCSHWAFWAARYREVPSGRISFDLLNEPCMREDMNDQHAERTPVPGALYRKLIIAAMNAIKQEKPDALIIADGNNIGADVIAEVTDLEVAQSCRAYWPHVISHYKAEWAYKDPSVLPDPTWPMHYEGQLYNRAYLEEMYAPWIALVNQGIGVHCGECGCYNQTPHPVFLAWFADVLDIFKTHNIGFALWNFAGDFGILNSGRKDVAYEYWYGQQLDRKLLTLLQNS